MSALNRRTALAMVATLPGAIIPVLGNISPDAELLDLGVQLEECVQAWAAVEEEHELGELGDRQNDLQIEILSRTAQTREGLAVQVRAISLGEPWEVEEPSTYG